MTRCCDPVVVSGAAVAVRWFGHPVTVLAGLVLAVNDHLLKAVWPGVVTGKLSDLAGLAVAPPLVGLVVALWLSRIPPRWLPRVALTATGLGFVLVKLTWTGAQLASDAWSLVAGPSQVLRDPIDLVALPALAIAWWTWTRSTRFAPVADPMVAWIRVVVVLPFLLFAVTATTAADGPNGVIAVDEQDGEVVIFTELSGAWSSTTGVDGWQPVSPKPQSSDTHRQECVPGEAAHCYRVHGAEIGPRATGQPPNHGRLLGVDETLDGGVTWRTTWEVPADRWPFLAKRHNLSYSGGADLLASLDILVRLVSEGHQVIVANGADGLAVRDADGTWHRVSVDADVSGQQVTIHPRPLTAFGFGLAEEIAGAVVLVAAAVLLASLLLSWRLRSIHPNAVMWGVLAMIGFPVSVLGFVMIVMFFPATIFSLMVATVATFVLVITALLQSDIPRPHALSLTGGCLLVGVGFVGPYLGWTVAIPNRYTTATALAWWLAGFGLVLTVAISWWAGGRSDSARPGNPRA